MSALRRENMLIQLSLSRDNRTWPMWNHVWLCSNFTRRPYDCSFSQKTCTFRRRFRWNARSLWILLWRKHCGCAISRSRKSLPEGGKTPSAC